MHRQSFTFILALSAAVGRQWVAAQSTTSVMNMTMFLNLHHTILSGSIVAVESGLTSVAVQCPSDATARPICRSTAHATLVEGSSSVGFSLTAKETAFERNSSVSTTFHVVESGGCTTRSTVAVTCTVTLSWYDARVTSILKSVQTYSTAVSTVDPAQVTVIPVTITAGLEKLVGGPTGAADDGAAASTSTSTSKAGAAPMITASPVVLVLGIAAAAAVL